ncbi:mas-related G-protein coupled receptor member D [Gracilinanus agilis]|uniref:mas-related G-protein coupled receptor member D n=1 Tax=Gracilinanus agilis TaxID=191870 RepID=UPI001CFC9BEC|nr:mas-related G-protein coupled receptor member D [Gracilinanus agilis]
MALNAQPGATPVTHLALKPSRAGANNPASPLRLVVSRALGSHRRRPDNGLPFFLTDPRRAVLPRLDRGSRHCQSPEGGGHPGISKHPEDLLLRIMEGAGAETSSGSTVIPEAAMRTTAGATNSSRDQETPHQSLVILALAICLCGLLGNGVIMWFLCFCMKCTPFSIYSHNLAIADFLLLFSTMLLFILERPELALWPQSVAKVFESIRYFAYVLGLSLLTAISVQRCVSVVFPAWYRRHQPKRLSALVCAGLWALATLETTAAAYFCILPTKEDLCPGVAWASVLLTLGGFTPVMCVSSVTLFIKVQRSLPPRKPATPYSIPLVTVLVYLVCALPLALYWFFFKWYLWDERRKQVFYNVARFFSCVNSTVNPFLYFLVGNKEAETLPTPLGTTSKGPGEREKTPRVGGESGAKGTIGQLSGGAA